MASIFHTCANLSELADDILDKFTPLAFKCPCEGEHEDCAGVLESASAYAQFDTAQRIAEYIRGLKP